MGGDHARVLARDLGALTLTLLLAAGDAHAASERRLRTLNVGAQAVMTLVSGLIQGKVKSLADAGNCLGSGAAGGYGAFAAKILVRNGHVGRGWLLANVSASLSENAAAGKLPWTQLGYTVGPLRLRASLDPKDDAYAYVDASAYQSVKLVQAAIKADATRFRGGMLVFERRTPYAVLEGGIVDGATWGIFPGVWTGAQDLPGVQRHEIIHAVQSLEADAVDPSFQRLTRKPRPHGERRQLIRFEHLKLGTVNLLDDTIADRIAYEEHWREIEAYRLAQRKAPPILP